MAQIESHSPRRSRREAERAEALRGYPPSAAEHGTERRVPEYRAPDYRAPERRTAPQQWARPAHPSQPLPHPAPPESNPEGPLRRSGFGEAPAAYRDAQPTYREPQPTYREAPPAYEAPAPAAPPTSRRTARRPAPMAAPEPVQPQPQQYRRQAEPAQPERTYRTSAYSAAPAAPSAIPKHAHATQVSGGATRRSQKAASPFGGPGGGAPPRGPRGRRPSVIFAAFQGPRRGSHATPLGQGFTWVVAWTVLGAVLPGSGLAAAGLRRLGGMLLTMIAVGAGMIAVVALAGDPVARFAGIAVDPQKLLYLAITVGVVAVAWIALIVATNGQLRRYAVLTAGQQAFCTLVVLALVAGIALPAYKLGSYALIQRDLVTSVFANGNRGGPAPDAGAADPWAEVPRVNVLLVGSDAGPTRQGVRPDTLILASIDTKSGDTTMFSLPRNLERVPFPEGTPGAEEYPNGYFCESHQCLLNAVWQWGEQNKSKFPDDPNPGLTATEQAVEGTLGLPVHYYALVNLQGFQDFVDAIGGVTVDVKQDLPIGGNSQNRRADGWIYKGENQKLNGFKALWFARSRWSTDDFDRIRRQRCVIGAAVQQADPAKLALGFPKLAASTKDNLATDIPREDLQAWVELGLRIKNASVRSLAFTNEVIADRSNPDFEGIRSLVKSSLNPPKKATKEPSGPGASASAKPKQPAGGGESEAKDPKKAQNVNDVC